MSFLKKNYYFPEAVKYYGSRLSEYERNEIQDYDEIWYLGLDACKIHGNESLLQNCGFDDDNGSYYKVSSLFKKPQGTSRFACF